MNDISLFLPNGFVIRLYNQREKLTRNETYLKTQFTYFMWPKMI